MSTVSSTGSTMNPKIKPFSKSAASTGYESRPRTRHPTSQTLLLCLACFLLGTNEVHSANTATSAPTQPSEQQLSEAEQELARLEDDANTSDPMLREVERLQRQLRNRRRAEQGRRLLIADYLASANAKPGAKERYEELSGLWFRRAHVDALRDPKRADLLRNYLASDADLR